MGENHTSGGGALGLALHQERHCNTRQLLPHVWNEDFLPCQSAEDRGFGIVAVHVFESRSWRGLAKVNELVQTAWCAYEHEATAANAAVIHSYTMLLPACLMGTETRCTHQ